MSAPEIYYPLAGGGGGGGVSGSGTANTIPRWDAGSPSTTLTDSLLSQSGAIITNSGTFLADNGSQAAPAYAFTSSPGTGMFCASTDPFLRFAVTGTYRVVVTAAGEVGVNTNVPRDMLHVAGGSIKVGADGIDSFLSFGDESVTTRNNGIYRPASSNTLTIGSYNLITFNVSNAALGSQAERMRITSTGNVGVGMTSGFSGKLGVLSANALSTADLTFSYDATGSYRHGFSNVFSSGTAANNTSTWLVWNAAGGQTQVMTANGAGNVGIGTASPTASSTIFKANNSLGAWNAQDLSVDGLSNGDAVYQRWYATAVAGAVGRFGISFSAGVASFVWNSLYNAGVTSSELMRLTGGGNLGIGTTSPISPLHVKGNATNTDGILTLAPNAGGRNHQVQSLQASSLFRIYDQSAGASRLEIDINGNISAATAGSTFNASTAGAGLKLPATPGNADTQTLDCYQEGTWAPTLAGFGGTNPTVTATLTRVGRLVTLTVQMQSTGGAQYSGTLGATTLTVPAGMTPNIPACTNLVNGTVQNLGNVAAYNDGLIYLPTFALTTAFTFFVVTYRV